MLIVAKRDRLGRDVLNVAMIQRLIERKGARVVSTTGEGSDDDGPTSQLLRTIVDASGQYERALIRRGPSRRWPSRRHAANVSAESPSGCNSPRAV